MVSRSRQISVAMLALATWLVSPPAIAQDRPDLLDVDDEAYRAAQSTLPPNVDYSYAYAGADEYDSISASGAVYGRDGSVNARVVWNIFEPDTIRRTSNRLSVKQKAYLGLAFYIYDGYLTATISTVSAQGCRASMKVVGEDTNATQARWRVSCRASALENLGLSAAQQQTLEDIFGNRLNFAGRGNVLP